MRLPFFAAFAGFRAPLTDKAKSRLSRRPLFEQLEDRNRIAGDQDRSDGTIKMLARSENGSTF